VPSWHYPGGYAESVIAPVTALARIPDELSFAEAAARAMGFERIAIARGADKEANARELGAHHYIDSTAGDDAAALQALGGAEVVLTI
jgi:alcohol dehydrogenase